jgi:hypothetical protein
MATPADHKEVELDRTQTWTIEPRHARQYSDLAAFAVSVVGVRDVLRTSLHTVR